MVLLRKINPGDTMAFHPKDTFFYTKNTLKVNGKLLDFNTPKVMGIMNLTPDSFYDGGRLTKEHDILSKAEKLLAHGADILDLGGYSTRPNAPEVSESEEADRLLPAIDLIIKKFPDTIISVDTFRSSIAEKAINHGAAIINDVSGGDLDPDMFSVVARMDVPYILMHMRGTPQTMMQLNQYDDLIKDILSDLGKKLNTLRNLGVKDIIVDPGFGFAKNIRQNFELLNRLKDLSILELPILCGVSRKSMIWKTLNITPEQALNGTTVLNTIALQNGANILRVHDVKEAKEAIILYKSVCP